MLVVYVAGPFRGPNAWAVEQNIRRSEELAFRVAETGCMPLCPHTNTRFFDGTLSGEFWLAGTLELMRRCDAVIFTPDYDKSVGALGELAEAQRLGLSCFFDIAALWDWKTARSAAE